MSKRHGIPKCSEEAIEVAWKLRRHAYRSKEGGIRALKRVVKGLTADEARKVITAASLVLEEAIQIVEPKGQTALEEYRSRVPNGPSAEDRNAFEQRLRSKYPDCTAEALRWALHRAVIYHIL